jgi:hypothetical protein
MKRTPGPWSVENRVPPGSADAMLVIVGGDVRAIPLAILDPDDEEAEANAQLMAAAPALLEVCKEIADSQCDLGNSERRMRLYSALHELGEL